MEVEVIRETEINEVLVLELLMLRKNLSLDTKTMEDKIREEKRETVLTRHRVLQLKQQHNLSM